MRTSPHGRTICVGADIAPLSADALGALASDCLALEIDTWPKPGLVSHIDAVHALYYAALHLWFDLLESRET